MGIVSRYIIYCALIWVVPVDVTVVIPVTGAPIDGCIKPIFEQYNHENI